MSAYLLVNGPCDGQQVELPDGVSSLKLNYDPQPLGTGEGTVTYKVGFYLRRDAYSLEWQPDPH